MKILITSVRAGSGHVRAAEALQEAFHRLSPGVEAVHVDIMDMVSPSFRRLYLKGYHVAVNRVPSLWGRLYHFWDGRASDTKLTSFLHRTQRHFADPFFEFLESFNPDLILTTHFLLSQLLTAQGNKRLPSCPVECVITDYDVHQFWISQAVSRYYVAHDGMIEALARRGVAPSQVVVSGIPVHPSFSEPVPVSSVFTRLGLDVRRPVLLVLSGGLGLNRLKIAVEHLLSLPGNPQIITVSGRNAILKRKLDELVAPASVKLLNLGYVDNMHELLAVSDLVITKPGGLTVSECLARKKPMVLISPIPGQEEKNAEFLTTRGAAVSVKSLENLPAIASCLLTDPARRHAMKQSLEACARPRAAFTIAQTILAPVSIAA